MNPVAVISTLLSWTSGLPVVGKYVTIVLGALLALSAVATAFAGLWHALVIFVNALAAVPGLSGLSGIAAALQADEAAIDNFENNTLLPLLSQLSALPLPSAPAAPPAPTTPPAAS